MSFGEIDRNGTDILTGKRRTDRHTTRHTNRLREGIRLARHIYDFIMVGDRFYPHVLHSEHIKLGADCLSLSIFVLLCLFMRLSLSLSLSPSGIANHTLN